MSQLTEIEALKLAARMVKHDQTVEEKIEELHKLAEAILSEYQNRHPRPKTGAVPLNL